MKWLGGTGFTLAALLVLAGCGSSEPGTASSTAGVCNSGPVHELVTSFINAFNAGDTVELDRLVAGDQQGFLWYSTDAPGQRFDPSARVRTSLITYFEQRHRQRERLELRSFTFNGNSAGNFGHGIGNFEFELIRSADGLGPTPYGGKGAASCYQVPARLMLWGMGREPFLRADLPLYIALAALLVMAVAGGEFCRGQIATARSAKTRARRLGRDGFR
ncbi:MAG TPA: hypothetical protein VGR77_01215 [Candidatus Dormibacteraeota bacterium]|nr:hypothetical protein [Candidatus Dormibacteraeota bacterium]